MTANAPPREAVDAAPAPPRCPITGKPAIRLIQTVSSRLLIDLWRYSGKTDVRELLGPAKRFRLWESPAGLAFFDPMVAGDDAFYRTFYDGMKFHEKLAGPQAVRPEFALAARHVRDGARVLDVGCGEGGFRRYVPGARYTGLDPHFAAADASGTILPDTLAAHADREPESYDVVCGFQVVEHTTDPLGFARAMARCLRPGGTLLIGVPVWPSPMTRIPNLVISLPPHHLTWWNEPALRALAEVLGFATEAVHAVPIGPWEATFYWMDKVNPVKVRGPFAAGRWTWHAALAWSYAAGSLLARFLPLPPEPGSNIMLLAARKPG